MARPGNSSKPPSPPPAKATDAPSVPPAHDDELDAPLLEEKPDLPQEKADAPAGEVPEVVRRFAELFATHEADPEKKAKFGAHFEKFVAGFQFDVSVIDAQRRGVPVGETFRVLENKTISMNGALTVFEKGRVIQSRSFGLDNLERVKRAGVKLERVTT